MKSWLLQPAIILAFTVSLCWPSEEFHTYPIPITEMAYLVSGWLTDSGMQIFEDKTDQGSIRIHGDDSTGKWQIILDPRSALSTAVKVQYEKNGGEGGKMPDLYAYLDRYPMNSLQEVPVQSAEIPKPILELVDSTVCLHSAGKGEYIEFSGFFIDNELILCTAHGLHEQQPIVVSTVAGQELKGDVIRLDYDRDLALIKIQEKQEKGIRLETGRNILNIGEKVYSTGCSVNKRGAVLAGIINGVPRRVGQHPLWQVLMEINPGRSGSAVFDESGAIVAVIKGRYRGTGTIGFLIPLETIMDFLNAYFTECNTDVIK
jgi:serine protease Do